GMGEELYEQVIGERGVPCRVYAPVGSHEDLLPYLVRRLLENGANTSFVNRIVDESTPIENIVADPVEVVDALERKAHPRIRLPRHLYGEERLNSQGVNLADPLEYERFRAGVLHAASKPWHATPIIDGRPIGGNEREVRNPADRSEIVGTVVSTDPAAVEPAIT